LSKAPFNAAAAHKEHPREFQDNKYIYPVISRRSGGVSIGVNLNIDKVCNFACPYCQVDRTTKPADTEIFVEDIFLELQQMLKWFDPKGICTLERFRNINSEQKILKDIALSGDGEPTSYIHFKQVCQKLYELQNNSVLNFELILITNGTMLHKPAVAEGVDFLLKENGHIWVKLDAGSEDYYQKVNHSRIPLKNILNNIKNAGARHPLTLQTLFFKLNGIGPSEQEINRYTSLLIDFMKQGVSLEEIQLHSISRKPAENFCEPLDKQDLEEIARKIHLLCDVNVKIY